jgi:ABC-type Fe3+/spermidine/putrescine transport system ATPase subunit
MTVLRCVELTKRYAGQQEYALGNEYGGVSFDVEQGELFALLGPSGCGKTTTLRIIGGFVDPTSGRVEVGGDDVTRRPPHSRPTNTVFQSYALFPHLSVGANVEFGLKMDGIGRRERQRRTREALLTVGLDHMAERRVGELSGGQQQRAALARAMVKQPAVLLLDEPLGALDLRLRRQMQDELVRLKRATGTTFVHVTHDQEEACAIADRIAVMDRGHIVQVDTPVELYRAPRTAYVAEFLNVGTVLHGHSTREGADIRVETPLMALYGAAPGWVTPGMRLGAVLPPDRVSIHPVEREEDTPDHDSVGGTVEHLSFTGSEFAVRVVLDDGSRLTAEMSRHVVSASNDFVQPGTRVAAKWRRTDVIIVEDTDETAATVEPAA